MMKQKDGQKQSKVVSTKRFKNIAVNSMSKGESPSRSYKSKQQRQDGTKMVAQLRNIKQKENAFMDITVAFEVKSNTDMIQMIGENQIKTKFDEQTRLFKLDFVFDGQEGHLDKLLSKVVFFGQPNIPSVSFFVNDHDHSLLDNDSMLKGLLGEVPLQSHEVYMSYYYVDWKKNTTNDFFGLPDNVQVVDYSLLARRRIHSVQHAFDLIQLGNLKNKHQSNKKDLVSVLKFEVLYDHKSVSHFLVDMVLGEEALPKDPKLIMLDNFICNRQRQKQLIDSNVLFDQICPCLNVCGARLILINQLSDDRLNSKQAWSYLDMLERIKQYGTEEDVFGDIILLKNQALLKTINSISNQEDKLKLYATLLNNVSILEVEMLEMCKTFLAKATDELEVHKDIYKKFVEANSQIHSTHTWNEHELAQRWLKMFNEAVTANKVMAEHVSKFARGLEQLKSTAAGDN